MLTAFCVSCHEYGHELFYGICEGCNDDYDDDDYRDEGGYE